MRHTMIMGAIVTLTATLVGAGIAFLSQWLFDRRQRTGRLGELLLEQSALLLALNDDFENRLWEERSLKLKDRVDTWDFTSSRLAKSKLEILSTDRELNNALSKLHLAGVCLGAYWRRGNCDEDILDGYLTAYRSARVEFLAASSAAVRGVLAMRSNQIAPEVSREDATDVARVLWQDQAARPSRRPRRRSRLG